MVENGAIRYIVHRVEDVTDFARHARAANAERREALELRSRTVRLEHELYQRAQELQRTNAELQEKAQLLTEQSQDLEAKNREIELARLGLEEKALQLELASQYKSEFLANMSQRAAELLAEDLDSRGPVRLSEVETQQRKILQVVRNLAESGQIQLGGKAEDAYV